MFTQETNTDVNVKHFPSVIDLIFCSHKDIFIDNLILENIPGHWFGVR